MNFPPEIDHLAEEVGAFIEHWGFKSIHGRIWTHIFLADGPVDAGTLQERTSSSKSLVSMSLHELMRYDVVVKAGKSDRGTTTYRPNLNLPGVIGSILRSREKRMLGRIFAAWKSLSELPAEELEVARINSKSLKEMGRIIRAGKAVLDGLIKGALPKFNIKISLRTPNFLKVSSD